MRHVVGLTMALIVLAGCAAPSGQITMEQKESLVADMGMIGTETTTEADASAQIALETAVQTEIDTQWPGNSVMVEADADGRITLHGAVDDEATATLIENAVALMSGVTRVRNKLEFTVEADTIISQ